MLFKEDEKKQMLDLLCKEASGQIVACNILDAVDAVDDSVVDAATAKEFLLKCLQAYQEVPCLTTKEIIGLFTKTARGILPTKGEASFLFMCRNPLSTAEAYSEFSTVMEVATFKKHLVEDDKVDSKHGAFLSNPDPCDPMLKEAVNDLNGRDDFYQENAKLGGNLFFWICPAEDLAAVRDRETPANHADAIRDLLGLIHHESRKALVEIRLPAKALQGIKHVRPTFADAGEHSRFRTKPDNPPRHTHWGQTVHLGLFIKGRPSIDGAPEHVAEPVAFNKTLGAHFDFIGGTAQTRGQNTEDSDAAFATRLLRGRNPSELRDRLLKILS